MNVRFQGLIGIKNGVRQRSKESRGWGFVIPRKNRKKKFSWQMIRTKEEEKDRRICGNHDKVRGITGVEQRNQERKLTTGVCERGENKNYRTKGKSE